MVNEILKEKWLALPDEEKQAWRVWAVWDHKRFARDQAIFEKAQKNADETAAAAQEIHVPKKRSSSTVEGGGALAHVPKKKKRH